MPAEKYHLSADNPVRRISNIDDKPNTPPIMELVGNKNTSTATDVATLAQKIIRYCRKL